MFDKETLIALQESGSINAAHAVLIESESTNNVTALPSDFKLHDFESFLPNRRRARGMMATGNVTAFVQYTTDHMEEGANVFVDQDNMTATAVLNLGMPDLPGHADNKATLKPEKTAAYKALLMHASGAGHTQKSIAEFMEDWADNITCFAGEGGIKTAQAIAAVRKITIEGMRKVESTEQALSASKSAFESVSASSTETLPTLILFACKPYSDIQQRTFALRLGVLTGEATPKVNLRISKLEEHQEEMAEELAALITAEFDAAIPVLLGSYSKSL